MDLVIVGAGWLGEQLRLQRNKNYARGQIQATCRDKLRASQRGIQYLHVENQQIYSDVSLKDAYWVCCIPPRSGHTESTYLADLSMILTFAQSLAAKGFLLMSSTSVYPEQGEFNERTKLGAITTRQRLQLEAEQLVLSASVTGKVLRLGGLMGPGRHPGRFVAGKQLKSSGQQTVNFVHSDDVIQAINQIIEQWHDAANLYNLVSPHHPSKQDFYQQACKVLSSSPPEFLSSKASSRIIDGSQICRELDFSYQHDDLFNALLFK